MVDRRDEDPRRAGLYSEALVRLLRSDRRVLCVLNRTGRSQLLACAACGELARCGQCAAAVQQPEDVLRCARCHATRPAVCLSCGGTRFKNARAGVTRVREELAALVGEPVTELTAASSSEAPLSRVVVGTEAVLRRIDRADAGPEADTTRAACATRASACSAAR